MTRSISALLCLAVFAMCFSSSCRQAPQRNNLAQLATGAHDELLATNNGTVTESQVQSWKENIDRIGNSPLSIKTSD